MGAVNSEHSRGNREGGGGADETDEKPRGAQKRHAVVPRRLGWLMWTPCQIERVITEARRVCGGAADEDDGDNKMDGVVLLLLTLLLPGAHNREYIQSGRAGLLVSCDSLGLRYFIPFGTETTCRLWRRAPFSDFARMMSCPCCCCCCCLTHSDY